MLSQTLDLTTAFNANNGVKLDVGQWQNATFHASGSVTGTINFTGTNDGGAIEGVNNDAAVSMANDTAIQATNLASGVAVTAIAAAGNFKITVGTKYIKVGGASAALSGKLIVFLTTPT